MKTKILIIAMVLIGSFNVGFASFPVEKKENTTISQSSNANVQQVTTESVKNVEQVQSDDNTLTSPAAGGKSQLIALLLCALVGVVGIHRFYLGYTTIGIIQLLTAGGCGIWALIDLVRIITGDLKPKDGDYTETL
jgi:TM2 domain-containing membrane protein YozV